MRYAGLNKNDVASGEGVCVTLFVQGCPHHCKGCHNPETWNFNDGFEYTNDTEKTIIEALKDNNIIRNLCIQGGEPLCEINAKTIYFLIKKIKQIYPNIKIYVWSGSYYEDLIKSNNKYIIGCLEIADILIDGPYIQEERDVTLSMRGSRNQRIINLKEKKND